MEEDAVLSIMKNRRIREWKDLKWQQVVEV